MATVQATDRQVRGRVSEISLDGVDVSNVAWDYASPSDVKGPLDLAMYESLSFKIDWDSDSDDSGLLIDVAENTQPIDMEYFVTNSDRWFFPVSFRVRDATLRWDESSTTYEMVMTVFSSRDTEAVFGSRLARPVFWLWRQWRWLRGEAGVWS